MTADLDSLRASIDAIDTRLLELLNERAKLSLAVGQCKATVSGPVFRPEREKAILDRLLFLGKSSTLPPRHIKNIWREIFSSSRSLQHPRRIAFLGPEGTHSHAAASAYFGHSMEYQPCQTFREIFAKVSDGACDLGVIPLENSLHGTVGQCFDLFLEYEVFIQAEFAGRIRHCLLSLAPDIASVHTVRSHPQALSQCELWLHNHIPNAGLLPAESTAAAAELCMHDPESAAIGNENLASLFSLPILASNIEDEADNQTRFVAIGLNPPARDASLQSSILFTVPHHPGALAVILDLLARASINMRKLESRPSRAERWTYAFFADLDVNLASAEHLPVYQALAAACHSLRLLGAYPSGMDSVI